jgi:glycosyltransferase involved in cell wall biosynthesis
MGATETDLPRSDLIGLVLLALLLLSPLVFKCRIEGLVIHPFTPLLMAAWVWVGWVSRSTFSSITRGWYIAEWQAWNVPVVLLVMSLAGLAFSLAVNSFRFGSFQGTGWLLLAKWMLYLAPLPLTVLLTLRRHVQVIALVSYVLPSVAFGTLLYSYFRLWQAMGGGYANAYVDASTTFFAMGTFAEVLSADGLTVRADTMSHTAYGMYLAFVQMFSLCLALFGGWDGLVNRRYAAVQGWVLSPLAMGGILLSGSRSSLVLMVLSLVILLSLILVNPGRILPTGRRVAFTALLLLAPTGTLLLTNISRTVLPTLDRLQETLASPLEIERTVSGAVSPLLQSDARAKQSVKNFQIRVWIWGQAVRYLFHHPGTILLGIGYDRKRFVEEVMGLPYAGDNLNYQTAHNLFLDILVKGGIVPLVPLVAVCAWLLWTTVMSIIIPVRGRESISRIGLGWALMSFWPALILLSFTGEELLTDNLLLHWTTLFGLLLGLGGLGLAAWLPNRMVHMTATAGVGGGPAYITALCSHHLVKGMEVRIFCSDEKPYVDIWRRMGIDLSVLPMRRPNALSVWQLLKELLRAPAPIHAHGRGAAFFAIWVKILVRVPVIYTPHGPHYAYNRGLRYVSGWLFELVCRVLLDAIIYVSVGEREVARKQGMPIGRSRVVMSGLVCEMDGPSRGQPDRELLRAELNIPSSRFVIGWIGRFHQQKGLDILMESIPAVSARIPEAIWVVVGDGAAPDIGACRAKLAASGLATHVLFLGARTDAFALIRAFDLYISTSRWEGLPLILLEVMEQGVPIVASDVVGNRDVLDGWGVFFASNDPRAAAEAQIRVATDGPLRVKLAATGRDVRRRCFSLPRMLNELDHAYREILGVRLTG